MKSKLRTIVARQLEKRVQRLLRENDIKVVAITGSVGKTSTKLAIAHVLRTKYRVLAHEGNYNSEISVPMTFFEIDLPETLINPIDWVKTLRKIDKKLKEPYAYQVVVVEMGADQPNDIQKFMRYIKPDIGIITAIQPVHVEGFGTYKNIVKEKMALAHGSRRVLVNAEDQGAMDAARELKTFETYGLAKADYLLPKKVEIKSIGHPARLAATAAFAVGNMLDVPEKEIKKQLESLAPVAGRMNPLSGKHGSMIIDDTYNASPKAVIAALNTLYEVSPRTQRRGDTSKGRKIAILGNMNELGKMARAGHEEVGAYCGKLDLLLTIGENANEFITSAAEKAGLKPDRIHRFLSPYEAGLYLDDHLKKGDVVLAKGSQNGVFAEEAVALLLAKPADRSKLIRQGPQWQARKKKQFGLE